MSNSLSTQSIEQEFNVNLGDARRTSRVKSVVSTIAQDPGESFLNIFSKPAEQEGFYRIVRNKHIELDALSEGHALQTAARADKVGKVLVLHDTTEFKFPFVENHRTHLFPVSSEKQSFWGHFSMVISADGLRNPLGMIDWRCFLYRNKLASDTKVYWDNKFGPLDYKPDRWLDSIKASEAKFDKDTEVIHVCDREADIFDLLQRLDDDGHRFIIRAAQTRTAKSQDKETEEQISDLLAKQEFMATRQITLSSRITKGRVPSVQKKHPARHKRDVELSLRYVSIRLQPPKSPKKALDSRTRPEKYHEIQVNVVEAIELNPPEGESPVRWLLVTTEPINSVKDLLEIIDMYRSRWLIEDFFKALKTGCRFQKRQMDSADTLLITLALLLPIAWRLLLLRHMERCAPKTSATEVVSPLELEILMAGTPELEWSSKPTVGDVMNGIARLGGHRKTNGPPGWLVLGRGWDKLIQVTLGVLSYLSNRSKIPL